MAELRDKLLTLAEPLLTQLGFELVDLEFVPGRSQAQVRIFIDKPPGEDVVGVTVDDCETVSREFSALMDVEDPIPQAYTLEVSSPGMDRVLRIPAHYERFVGTRVHVELKLPRDGRKRFTGSLTRCGAKGIELEVDGTRVELSFTEIAKARLVPEWPENKVRRR